MSSPPQPRSGRSRARVWRQRLILGLLAACFALALFRLPTITQALVSSGLGGFFKRPVTIAEVRFHLNPLEAEILGLRVGGATPEEPPFLYVPRIVAVPRLGPLWGRRIVLEELRFEGLEIQIHAYPESGDDIPKMGGGGGGGSAGVQVEIGRVEIRDGSFALDHDRVPMDLVLPDFRGELRRRAGLLSGNLSFGPGSWRFGDAEVFAVGTDMELVVRGSDLDVPRGRLWTERIQLTYAGRIRLAEGPSGRFDLKGRVDLDELDRHVMRTGFGITGDARWDGEMRFVGSRLEIEGRMQGTAGEFDDIPVERFGSHVYWSGGRVRFADLEVDTMQGSGRVQIDLAPADTLSTMTGELTSVDAEDLLTRLIFDVGEMGFAGRATGRFDVRWHKGRFDELTGFLGADIISARDGIPLGGRFDWTAEEGRHRIVNTVLDTPTTHLELDGTIVDGATNLTVEATSVDLAATDEELRRVRRSLGTLDAVPVGFGGRGRYSGVWGGTIDVPVFSGRLEAPEISWLGVSWGVGAWRGRVTPTEVVTQELRLERTRSALRLSGSTETGYWGEADRLDLEVEFDRWPAEDLIEAFHWDVDFQAPLTGAARVRGRRSVPEGYVRVESAGGRYYGIPFGALSAESLFGGSVAALSRGQAALGGGQLELRGSLTDTGVWDAGAEGRGVQLAALELLPEGLPVSGVFEGVLTLQGALERPRITARLESADVLLGGESLGPVTGRAHGTGDGAVVFEARSAPEAGLTLAGHASAAPPWDGELRVEARQARLDPYLREFFPALPAALQLAATGHLTATGRPTEPASARVALRVEELGIGLPDYTMRLAAPIAVEVATGRFDLDSFRLEGDGTDLEVSGRADIEKGLDVRVRGAADLRVLQVLEPRLRGRGSARLEAAITGAPADPRVNGTFELAEAALRLRGIPHGLDDVEGVIRFTEKAAELERLVGTLGGGEVQVEGQVGFAAGGLASMDLAARGRSISLRWPEGLRSRLDSELRVFGDADRQWITGSVGVRRAEWTQRYDLASELLAGRGATWEPEATLSEGVRLDVRVDAPGTLRIDNNLAALQASADLRLQGTVAAPVLVGRAELDRGRVYFQGNTYVIRHGTIDFADTRQTQPLFDVEAETRIRSYRVTLRLNGSLERVVPTLTSDPPLSPIQILNLLAGADESAVASLAPAQAEQARLAAAGAATLAASRLTEEVGLERGAERLLGLNRFSIDPSVLRGDFSNPTARLTLGKRITPDLNVQYSQDLSSDADRLVTFEYTLSDRLSILLTQAEPGGLGLDVRIRQTR